MQIQISWLLQKPTDLDLHCLQRQGIPGFSRTRVKLFTVLNTHGPEVIKLFSCSTQLSMKFILLINLKLLMIVNSFLLNIAEHENFSANKYENANSFITSGHDPIRYLDYTKYLVPLLHTYKYLSKINLTLKAPRKPASENVVCLCRLLNILANFSNLFLHTGKQWGPRSDCS